MDIWDNSFFIKCANIPAPEFYYLLCGYRYWMEIRRVLYKGRDSEKLIKQGIKLQHMCSPYTTQSIWFNYQQSSVSYLSNYLTLFNFVTLFYIKLNHTNQYKVFSVPNPMINKIIWCIQLKSLRKLF